MLKDGISGFEEAAKRGYEDGSLRMIEIRDRHQ
jgi:hypothetical protein